VLGITYGATVRAYDVKHICVGGGGFLLLVFKWIVALRVFFYFINCLVFLNTFKEIQ
jgi:hypothetical protein